MAEEMTEEEVGNVVYVGNKPVMNYVLAVVTQMNGGAEVVSLKARGRAISRAVDVAEIVRNRFMPNVEIEDINISTEEIVGNDGTTTNVSAIEIRLKNPNPK
ncbi:nucleoid protein Alba [Methanothermus fervidus DSM 2088]|uniref:DNA/RNA-binding protein Alba n=1 Tax=Methanothermus fervidus (strain ATCC 43054 / DSM 2088 / JCM 10308 / V24 S) TaxID=523846 RepID=E3GX15_METFV|nr:nucleoid protein Alba [Methanothermus fervidus DSM 2088]